MLCALIMAGGKGERFWPLSTEDKPKQFLNLLGNDTMIQMTVKRLKGLIPIERIFVVTAQKYEHLVKKQLPEISSKNIIIEPVGKNTAPSIVLSAFYINSIYEDATIAVLPSDHLIIDEEEFRNVLRRSYEFIEENNEATVTIGIEPSRAEIGYGYIKCRENEEDGILPVSEFVEKPTLEKAKNYLSSGNYLWNGGMFVWNVKTIISLAERFLNSTYNILKQINLSDYDNFNFGCRKLYKDVESVSIDYAIMEKAENIYVIKGTFGWDDVGSWNSVERYSKKAEQNNIFKGKGMSIDGNNNLIVSGDKPIVTVGMDNILVVESNDIIFVANKDSLDKIKDVRKKVAYNYY